MNIDIKKFKLFAFLLTMICIINFCSGQCITSQIQEGTGYINNTCGNLQIQSLVTQNANLFGECGKINFTPPIGGGVEPTRTSNVVNRQIRIYPNPFSETFTIDIPNNETYTLKVFNTIGRLIYIDKVKNKHGVGARLNMQGLHIVHLYNDIGQLVYSQQIIKI